MTYVELNVLNVVTANIRNAYIQENSAQKEYSICGPKFGLENIGKRALISR